MKTIEQGKTKFGTWLGNATALPLEWIVPVVALHLGYTDGIFTPRWSSRISFGRKDSQSLFYNGIVYVRFMLPFWVGIQIRWAGKDPVKKEYLQTGLGFKLNGRLAALFRVQSDNASAAGVSGPNLGQAWGWQDGTK